MSGWNTIKAIRDFEQRVYDLGFEIKSYPHDDYHGQSIKLSPRDDCLPHYSRDADCFVGSIEDCIIWLRGIQWARDYDMLVGLSTDKKRDEREQKERNRQLMQAMKTGQRQDGKITTFNGMNVDIELDEEVPF